MRRTILTPLTVASPKKKTALNRLFVPILLLAALASLYSLYVLNNTNLFFITFPFCLTLFLLYVFNTLFTKKKSAFSIIFVILFLITSISLLLYYFLYFRPSHLEDPIKRIQVTSIGSSWQTDNPNPLLQVKGLLVNNNPFDIFDVQIKIEFINDSDGQIITSQEITLPLAAHNSTTEFQANQANISASIPIRYQLTVIKFRK